MFFQRQVVSGKKFVQSEITSSASCMQCLKIGTGSLMAVVLQDGFPYWHVSKYLSELS